VKVMLLSIEKIASIGWSPKIGSAGAIETAVDSLLRA